MKIRNAAVALATATTLTATGVATADVVHTKHVITRMNVCDYEDGSGQGLCVWDARHMGNGKGRSVIIVRTGKHLRDEHIIPISHRRAHWLARAWIRDRNHR